MCIGYLWNNIHRGKPKYSVKNHSHCHSSHHKTQTDWPGIETGPPRYEAGDKNATAMVRSLKLEFDLIYRVSQEECARLRESVPSVKVYRYNPKHLYPKLNGYGYKNQRKVGASCGSKYWNLHSWCVTRDRWWPWEWNAVSIVPAWRLVACTGVGSAM